MAEDKELKNQPQAPSQPAEKPEPPTKKFPPEIKPDEGTMMRFQGSQDIKSDPSRTRLNEGKN